MDLSHYLTNIDIFKDLQPNEIQQILYTAQVKKFPLGYVILNEGELADSLYIILKGSAQVFTYDRNYSQVILARLDEYSCFGEQGYIHNFIRTASVKALTDVEVIQINYDVLDPIFKKSNTLRKVFEKMSFERSIANLNTQLSSIQSSIKDIFKGVQFKKASVFGRMKQKILPQKPSSSFVKSYKPNEIIFKKGDPFDFVYWITTGSVSLSFDHDTQNQMIINKNTIFGEVGLLKNKPRAATAIANTNTTIIAIPGGEFLQAFRKNKTLQSLSLSLEQVYSLPHKQVIANQYLGKFENADAIFTAFQLASGKTVICAKVINQPIFTMKISNLEPDHIIKFKRGDLIQRKIGIKDNLIVEITASGDWDELNFLCSILLDETRIYGLSEENFLKTGNLLSLSSNSSYYKNDTICQCMHVSYGVIKEKVMQGCHDFNQLSQETGACKTCGSCRNRVLDILGQSDWLYATIHAGLQYNENVCSFLIKPIDGTFPIFIPGQFITVKLQVDGLWYERSYTLVSYARKKEFYEIIVKRYAKGKFSQWLFEHKNEDVFVWISKPSGKFVLPPESHANILCFAGGIGITPFIAFIRDIKELDLKYQISFVYAVENIPSTIVPDDIDDFIKGRDNIDLTIWDTITNGLINATSIRESVKNRRPDFIYICGPEGFENHIVKHLTEINFDSSKIITERFLPASGE